LVEDLTHCNRSNAIQEFAQSQKPNNTEDTNNGPLEATHNHMGIQLVKLNETIGKILEVKCIPKMLKNHAKGSSSRKMAHAHESWPKKIQG
jgi:hypothetical protein